MEQNSQLNADDAPARLSRRHKQHISRGQNAYQARVRKALALLDATERAAAAKADGQ